MEEYTTRYYHPFLALGFPQVQDVPLTSLCRWLVARGSSLPGGRPCSGKIWPAGVALCHSETSRASRFSVGSNIEPFCPQVLVANAIEHSHAHVPIYIYIYTYACIHISSCLIICHHIKYHHFLCHHISLQIILYHQISYIITMHRWIFPRPLRIQICSKTKSETSFKKIRNGLTSP